MSNTDKGMFASNIICQSGMFEIVEHPKTEDAHDGARCRLCAMPLDRGVRCKYMSKSITNIAEIASSHEPLVCEYCMSLMQGKNIAKVQGYLPDKTTNQNLFGMLYIGGESPKAKRVTHTEANTFIMSPPVPPNTPFVFLRRVHHIMSNSTSRHTAWMARVSLNKTRYFLQIGNQSLQVDTTCLKEVIGIIKRMETQSFPIYGADWILRKVIKGDQEILNNLVELSQYSHDNIIVAAHLIESEKKATEIKNSKNKVAKK